MDTNDEKVDVIISTMLYILGKLDGQSDFHKIFKILYFAEQKHLVKYGSLISEASFIRMNNGPVPTLAYDILNSLKRGSAKYQPYFTFEAPHHVYKVAEPDMEWLSQTEVACIDESIEENKVLSFANLTEKSHDTAWQQAKVNREMDPVLIAAAGGASKEMLDYIQDHLLNKFAEFE